MNNDTLKILVFGDIALSYMPEKNAIDRHYIDLCSEDVYSIFNLENVVSNLCATPIKKSGPNLGTTVDKMSMIDIKKFGACTLANNHIGDYGEEGIKDTISFIEQNEIDYVGVEKTYDHTTDKYNVLRKEIGKNISIISVCENEFGISRDGVMGVCGYNQNRMKITLNEEKKWADFIIVIIHGGIENYPFPTPEQKNRYHFIADMGASAVIGMHSHCPVGYEIYEGKPIVYGTGNFLFPLKSQSLFQSWNYGYAVLLEFRDNTVKMHTFPYRFDYDGSKFEIIKDKWFGDYLDELCKFVCDDNKLKELFYAWVLLKEDFYRKSIINNASVDDINKLCFMRNIFTCEAHNEIIKTLYDMEYAKQNGLWNKNLSSAVETIKKYISIDHYKCDTSSYSISNVIWGFGDRACEVFCELTKLGVKSNEILVVDKDRFKQGLYYYDNCIEDPHEALNKYKTAEWFICVPERYRNEIREDIISNGIAEEQIHEN